MSAKIPPQERAISAMRAMVEARRGAGIADANEWLARGWNPFISQSQGGPSAVDLMGLNYLWVEWLWSKRAPLAPLFASAYPAGANGLSNAGRILALAAARSDGSRKDFLTLLIELGADPNSPGERFSDSPFNLATRSGAETLAAAGGIPASPPNRPSVWDAWAQRVIYGHLSLADLDWIEKRCSPCFSTPRSPVGRLALDCGRAGMLGRMASLGAGPEYFGLDSPRQLAKDLRSLAVVGDDSKSLSAIIGICGQEAVLDAFLRADPDDGRPLSALDFSLLNGRVRCLGVMARAGLLARPNCSPMELAKANALLWKAKPLGGYGLRIIPNVAGAVWCMSRIPGAQANEAVGIFALYAAANPMAAAPLALTCSSKGFLPPAGPLSLHELYLNGASWSEAGPLGRFSEFVALCEAKMLRKSATKKAAPPSRSRMRL